VLLQAEKEEEQEQISAASQQMVEKRNREGRNGKR
jgi:hypothetical protein